MADKTAGRAPQGAALKWIGGALAGLILGALALYLVAGRGDEPAAEGAGTAAVAPEAEPAAPEAATPEPAAEPADSAPPSFDTVRAEADGSVLVAGRAEAGAAISVLVDGAEAAAVAADAGGTFVALFTLPPSEAPRVVTLLATLGDGSRLPSDESVIIAPVAAPEVVAEVAPEAEPAAPVAEAPTPEVLVADDDGVRRQTAPGPVDSIVIDTIGYGLSGDVEIDGRGRAEQFARIYLDNRDVATAEIGADGGWSVALADIAAGLYTLRVDQVDGTGKVTSRFETPFQREAPEAVAAALALEAAPESKAAPAEAGATATSDTLLAAGTPAPEIGAAPGVEPAPQTGDAPVAAETAEAPAGIAPVEGADAPPGPVTRATIVTVQPGFTLWRIARENYGDGFLYVRVFEANRDQIRDPDLIYPGQIFTVPEPTE